MNDQENIHQPVADLIYTSMSMPAAIWILDPKRQIIEIKAVSRGLPTGYGKPVVAKIGDGSIISRTIENSKPVKVADLKKASQDPYLNLLTKANLRSLITYPVKVRNQIQGVIEVFSSKEDAFRGSNFTYQNKTTLCYLSDLTSLIIEKKFVSRESIILSDLARAISGTFDFNKVIGEIVNAARKLTYAHSSVIVFSGNRSKMFDLINTFSCSQRYNCTLCHDEELTQYIIRQNIPFIMAGGIELNIVDDDMVNRVTQRIQDKEISSIIGIPVDMKYDLYGVLYVCGERKSQFTEHHVELLENLSYQLSMIIGRPYHILRETQDIDSAISDLLNKKKILDRFCADIVEAIGFEYATISLKRFENNIIEAVSGAGFGRNWMGLSKHSLQKFSKDKKYYKAINAPVEYNNSVDIQVDISLSDPPRCEIISGWDPRFDPWIYKEFNHDQIVRITSPIVLLIDQFGRAIEEWPKEYKWEKILDEKRKDGGQHTVLILKTPVIDQNPNNMPLPWIVGTIGAGYKLHTKDRIEPEEAIELNRYIAENSIKIRKMMLHHVLQKIVEGARQSVSANSAVLNFYRYPDNGNFVYKVFSGKSPLSASEDIDLRHNLPEDLDRDGVKAQFDLSLDVEGNCGELILHFDENRHLTANERDWLKYFQEKAVDVIKHATIYTQMNERDLKLYTLNKITGLLTKKTAFEKNLLPFIANSARNLLAADLVIIYKYEDLIGQFDSRFEVSGRLLENMDRENPVTAESSPMLLVEHRKNKKKPEYETDVTQSQIFFNEKRKKGPEKLLFIEREEIKSAAGILLRAEEEIVGVMFVNYRRVHPFNEDEKVIIDTLAFSAAIAIKNQKMLRKLQDDITLLAHDLQGPLDSTLTKLNLINKNRLEKTDQNSVKAALALVEELQLRASAIMLSLSSEAGKKETFRAEKIRPLSEIKKIFNRLKIMKMEKNLEIKCARDEEFPKKLMNKNIFKSVLRCLIENAIKYADHDSIVTNICAYDSDANQATVHIISIGSRIDPNEKDAIFEKYYRGKRVLSKPPSSGAGFGLWAARQLMRDIGGDLTLELDLTAIRRSEFIVHVPKKK